MTARTANGAGGVPQSPYGVNPNPPPYFDDGSAGALITFAANTSALAGGVSSTDDNPAPGDGTVHGTVATAAGGTDFNLVRGTYPGATAGLVPASTSVAHEGAGTETIATWGVAPWVTNSGTYTGVGTIVANPAGTPVMVGCGPALSAASILAGPNATHASSMSPATNPALVSIGLGSSVSGAGTTLLTCTGTAFTPQCRIWVNNVEQATTFVSATSLTSTIAKKAQAGTWPVVVKLAGVQMGVTSTITWT
jgi:hypothetical protein